jgi:uncharacterized protein YecT (DUF1311 family)
MTTMRIVLGFWVLVPTVVFAFEDCGVLPERGKEDCVVANYNEADRDLNRVYQRLLDATEEKEPLRKAQRAWIQFRDAECSYVGTWETLTKNGPWLNRYECLRSLTQHRTEALARLQAMYESRPQDYEAF